ncbi:selenocysteine-specific translation elongation factor [Listeria costaricensis]|uniref:selenocysteine-specific translation elongation factor n=1 Tax=Listeria costaricensis TaxID=2026604 RepID=UPI000C071523|nr:selenocysteine-specific translation elongation factor [Listeria costaricensis]
MKRIVIGTAGHVDHGKTTLIRALTGMETDTTKEEKKRGLSIDLGFAYFELPSGRMAGIVDVPGHERFMKNMLAGAQGVELVLLVIDAQEGVMPQTKEHAAILELLGVENFIIVVTKCGLVDEEMRELVELDIREQLASGFLETAPLLFVDAVERIGLEPLVEKIDQLTTELPEQNTALFPYMPIDRAFTVKGFGTVVTGTLLQGEIHTGEELMLYPACQKVKVRNIQIHEENVSQTSAGMRTALNITGVKAAELKRGCTLAPSDQLEVSWMLDVELNLLQNAPESLVLWDRVRLYIGTSEVMARAVPIGQEEIAPGETGFVQLRLEEQVAVKKNDAFIIRNYSPMYTLGGGRVIDPHPAKHKRFHEDVVTALETQASSSTVVVIAAFLNKRREVFSEEAAISQYIGKTPEETKPYLQELEATQALVKIGDKYTTFERFAQLSDRLEEILMRYHKRYRLRYGMPKAELFEKAGIEIPIKQLEACLAWLAESGKLRMERDQIQSASYEIKLNPYQEKERQQIEAALMQDGFTPRSVEELTAGQENLLEMVAYLTGSSLVRLDHEFVIARDYYEKAITISQTCIAAHGKMTLADFRDLTGSSRRYAMLILETLDKEGITKRVENYRVLG